MVRLDVQASSRPNEPDARVRLASAARAANGGGTSVEVVHRFDEAARRRESGGVSATTP
jgi:hypothetical protein